MHHTDIIHIVETKEGRRDNPGTMLKVEWHYKERTRDSRACEKHRLLIAQVYQC